jgi:predicted nucleic acid-binding protein
MYAVGTEHPLKKPSLEILRKVTEGEMTAVTDTEVFQEIAYRYWSQKKWAVAVDVLKDYQHLFSEILPIEKKHLEDYYSFLSDYDFLSPRDAIHIAVMKSHHLKNICTTDQAFRKIPFLKVCFPL